MGGRFSGRRIGITGAGGGLGFSYAERLCREGASVIIAEIDPVLGTEAEASLKAQGLDARFVQVDISSETSVAEMARIAREGCDGIDGLVANAGWANGVGGKTYDELTAEVWDA